MKDFNHQMEEAWERVTGSSRVSDTSLSDDFEHELNNTRQEIALETLHILRSRYRREKEYWSDLFQKKDYEIKQLQEKLGKFDAELANVGQQLDAERIKSIEHLKQDIGSAQEKQIEFEKREQAFLKELEYYKQMTENANTQLATEKDMFTKLRDQWQDKEKEWEILIRDREEEAGKIRLEYAEKELELIKKQKTVDEDKEFLSLEITRLKSALESEQQRSESSSKVSQVKIEELQSALDKSYKQLEMEQKLREINLNEFKQYKAEIQHLKDGRQRMLEEWDKERNQWKELWDKERLIWEKRKAEVVEWEKRLRQERERWILSGVPEPEKLLKEFFQQPGPVPEIPKESAQKGKPKMYLRPVLAATWNAVILKKRTRARRIFVAGFSIITIAVGTHLFYPKTMIYPITKITPSAFSIDAKNLLLFDREKSSIFFFVPSNMNLAVKTVTVTKELVFDSCALAGGLLWTCNTADKKIYLLRRDNPSQVEGVFSAPSDKTTLLAWDGDELWSYDAVKGDVILHAKDSSLSVKKRFFMPDIEPSAMCWGKGYLWVYDSLSHELFKFRREKENIIKVTSLYLSRKLSVAPIRDVSGIGFKGDSLWISSFQEKKIVRYNFNRVKLNNFLPFF